MQCCAPFRHRARTSTNAYRWISQTCGRNPEADHPERYNLVVDSGRVRAVLLRIAADIDELARARSVEELEHSQVDPDARAERRRRLAEPPLAFPAHGKSIRQCRQALYGFEKERWRRGEADSHPFDRDIYPPEKGTY